MLALDDVLIDDELASRMFCCDIMSCKGACCVEGELGAPVRQHEVERLDNEARKANPHLSEKTETIHTPEWLVRVLQGRDLYADHRRT